MANPDDPWAEPNATVDFIVASLEQGQWEDAYGALNELRYWLKQGRPEPTRDRLEDLFAALTAHLGAYHEFALKRR